MSEEKMVILIDGPNLFAAAKTIGFDLDYKKLLAEFRTRGNLVRAKYYTAVDDAEEFSTIVPLIDWLDYNGYSVVTKSMKSFTDGEGRRKTKGNMNVDIAVEAMELAPYVGHIVLFSGDGDFRAVVEARAASGCSGHGHFQYRFAASNLCRRVAETGRCFHRSRGVAPKDQP